MILGPGVSVDRYEIVRAVATGGMGTVWLAQLAGKHCFAKRVALKTVRADLAQGTVAHRMFVDEARIVARIDHVNVAQVLDVGELDGDIYIVLEWVDGVSLEQLCEGLAAPPPPLAEMMRIVADACAGLHAAHELCDEQGELVHLVHRDVSPHNILVSRAGSAKIIDFGIAKTRGRSAGETETGIVKGKRAYMAPEQALGDPLDRRADIWSMGAVLYRALVGRPPLDQAGTLAAFVGGKLVPEIPAEIPRAVAAVIARALALAPADRYATAAELGRAIEDAMPAPAASADVASRFAGLLEPTYEEPPVALAETVAASPAARPAPRPSRTGYVVGLGALLAAGTAVGFVAIPMESATVDPAWPARLAALANQTARECGAKIAYSIDEMSFATMEPDERQQPDVICGTAYRGLALACRDPAARAAIATIREVACGYQPGKWRLALDGATLRFAGDGHLPDGAAAVRDWLRAR